MRRVVTVTESIAIPAFCKGCNMLLPLGWGVLRILVRTHCFRDFRILQRSETRRSCTARGMADSYLNPQVMRKN